MDVAIFWRHYSAAFSRRQYAADKKSYNWQSIHTQAIVTITGDVMLHQMERIGL